MFYFYRKGIQIHIRSILEFNQEFKEEHMIQHSHNLTRYCWRMFIAWACCNIFIQVILHVIFSDFHVPIKWAQTMIDNCYRLVNEGTITEDQIW